MGITSLLLARKPFDSDVLNSVMHHAKVLNIDSPNRHDKQVITLEYRDELVGYPRIDTIKFVPEDSKPLSSTVVKDNDFQEATDDSPAAAAVASQSSEASSAAASSTIASQSSEGFSAEDDASAVAVTLSQSSVVSTQVYTPLGFYTFHKIQFPGTTHPLTPPISHTYGPCIYDDT